MDLATILGIFIGLGLMILAIVMEGDVTLFLSLPSLLIVFGGTFASIMVNFSMKEVLSVFPLLRVAFSRQTNDSAGVIETLVEFAEISRREGLLALEERAQATNEPFLQKGIQLIVDGTDAELVRNILEIELLFPGGASPHRPAHLRADGCPLAGLRHDRYSNWTHRHAGAAGQT